MSELRRLPLLSAPELAFVEALAAAVARSVFEEIRAGRAPAVEIQPLKMRTRADGQSVRALADSQDEQRILQPPAYV